MLGDTIPAAIENIYLLIVSYSTNIPDLITKSKKITKIVDYWPGLSSQESTN